MEKRGQRGFTLMELVVVIGVLSTLAALMVPMAVSYIANARIQRAKADMKAIETAIVEFNNDMREWPIWASGSAMKPGDPVYKVLCSEKGDNIASGTDYGTLTDSDSLDDQLITNDPGYPTSPTGVRKWQGPYLEAIPEDPWGNKYYVVVKFLWPAYRAGQEKAAFVISAGPNEAIETAFEQNIQAFSTGGDDIVHRIR